jgi:hypothetical protein
MVSRWGNEGKLPGEYLRSKQVALAGQIAIVSTHFPGFERGIGNERDSGAWCKIIP